MTAISFTARNIRDVVSAKTHCAILPVFHKAKLTGAALQLDRASDGSIRSALALGDFAGNPGETLLLPGTGGAKRILLIGCGDPNKFDRKSARNVSKQLHDALCSTKATDSILHLGLLKLKERDACWLLSYLARFLTTASYRYTETLSSPKKAMKLSKLIVNASKELPVPTASSALRDGHAMGLGVNEARNLANLPGNICTPTHLARHARKLARNAKKLSVSVLEEKKMREMGMGALLSVSAGSDQPAKLIVMHYEGGKSKDRPHVLVGKGITFDSGGISLKPGAKMDEMKFDMGGAASVFGTLRAAIEMNLPLNVVGIVAAAENMPSGRATKPGDVVTSMAGKTIEVLNTDAEGRLVLCDALAYAARYKPDTVIDIATLTGACVVALGSHASALYANNDSLADDLLEAGIETYDRAWRMPLWEEYNAQLKSNFADLANIGGPGGGSITAACFLGAFTKKYRWAHLDIAGSAWNSAPKGATGRPVPLLTRFLMDKAGRER
ncbi:MAG: leucyl aminopeptidase [Halioglobus sp.]|nr:leucyl aminopeptidase [Halioglobus sp.]